MTFIIHDLYEPDIDRFINDDSDRYGRVIRSASDEDPTFDLEISVRTVAVDDKHIIIEYPNGNTTVVPISSDNYHYLEIQ